MSADAVEAVELAARLTTDTGFRALEPETLRVRAEMERLHGDEAARQRALQEAHRILVEIGATARAARVAQEISVSAGTNIGGAGAMRHHIGTARVAPLRPASL